jgi:hypothetical protein
MNPGANRMKGAEKIPLRIVRYLLDLPDQYGYTPADDNDRPRVRLAKYLWHDGVNPLGKALPTPEEKLSILYDGEDPDINDDDGQRDHPKGYRVFPQIYWGQAELEAHVVLKCYIGRVIPYSDTLARIGLAFEILVNSNLENTTKTDAYSRAYAIETCITEALVGVDIAGVGPVRFSRPSHIDNGSSPLHDNGTHVGRMLYLSIDWTDGNGECTVSEECG